MAERTGSSAKRPRDEDPVPRDDDANLAKRQKPQETMEHPLPVAAEMNFFQLPKPAVDKSTDAVDPTEKDKKADKGKGKAKPKERGGRGKGKGRGGWGPKEKPAPADAAGEEGDEGRVRHAKRKVALLMSFCGTGCSGMQCEPTDHLFTYQSLISFGLSSSRARYSNYRGTVIRCNG
jgi:tRNA pseudouridine38-40 synthase